jgi:hypothetical protein
MDKKTKKLYERFKKENKDHLKKMNNLADEALASMEAEHNEHNASYKENHYALKEAELKNKRSLVNREKAKQIEDV